MTAIELRGVTVTLGGRAVVDDVDAEVAEGEWLGLIGPNGAGKTTLLRAIGRLVRFTGEITLAGQPTSGLGRRELSRLLAVVPQSPSTPGWMTVGRGAQNTAQKNQKPFNVVKFSFSYFSGESLCQGKEWSRKETRCLIQSTKACLHQNLSII